MKNYLNLHNKHLHNKLFKLKKLKWIILILPFLNLITQINTRKIQINNKLIQIQINYNNYILQEVIKEEVED